MLAVWRSSALHGRRAVPLAPCATFLQRAAFSAEAAESSRAFKGSKPKGVKKGGSLRGIPLVDVALPVVNPDRPKMVILGAGWGAINVLQNLDDRALKKYNILVCSPTNHWVNTPLLPSVTVGTLGPRAIAEPIRNCIVAHRKRCPEAWIKFNEVEAIEVDSHRKRILAKTRGVDGSEGAALATSRTGVKGMTSATVETEFWVDYDVLVCAVGATTNTFGTPGALQYCTFLKTIQDAMRIRTTLLDCFETAAVFGTPSDEVDRLLSFVIVGAGPTGVEIAAELRDFAKEDVLPRYSGFKDREIKITIIEMTDRMLGTYDKVIQSYAQASFNKLDIETLTKHQVKKVNPNSVEVLDIESGETKVLPFGMCVWASGVRPNNVSLQIANDVQGTRMLEVDGNLRVRGAEGSIFALGDCAKITHPTMVEKAHALFNEYDVDGNGVLDEKEFRAFIAKARTEYPQLEAYLSEASKASIVSVGNPAELGPAYGDKVITKEDFHAACAMVDRELKILPPTAQVAAQQGVYLAKILNEAEFKDLAHVTGFKPEFEYNHMGSMAYIGGEHAAIDSPITGVSSGLLTYIMWKGVYFGKSVSWTMRFSLLFDWAKSWFLGRDTSRL